MIYIYIAHKKLPRETLLLSVFPGTPADDADDKIGGQIEKFISALVELLVDVPVL